jgi:hypothetical protein
VCYVERTGHTDKRVLSKFAPNPLFISALVSLSFVLLPSLLPSLYILSPSIKLCLSLSHTTHTHTHIHAHTQKHVCRSALFLLLPDSLSSCFTAFLSLSLSLSLFLSLSHYFDIVRYYCARAGRYSPQTTSAPRSSSAPGPSPLETGVPPISESPYPSHITNICRPNCIIVFESLYPSHWVF